MDILKGTLSPVASMKGILSASVTLSGKLTVPYRVVPNPYQGEYTVEPGWESQTLETQNKTLTDDITVNAIYFSEVSNPSGGKTVYIGGEFNG